MSTSKTMFNETNDDMKFNEIGSADVKNEDSVENFATKKQHEGWFDFKTPVIWRYVVIIFVLHAVTLYEIVTFPVFEHKLLILWSLFLYVLVAFGITAGVHRYWSHRTYKAKLPLQIILLICFQLSGQHTISEWVQEHRVHHKYTETDADPHNSKRGFFFAHWGWIMLQPHPEFLRRCRQVDMSDIIADPVVQFHQKYFYPLKLLICFILPTIIPVYLWNEDWYYAIMSQAFIRYVICLNVTWSVNSFAHLWGNRSYDKTISPADNKYMAFLTIGEGWHNYHHVFPWDYKSGEFSNYRKNLTTTLIDGFAKIGWAYDMRSVPENLIEKVSTNRGDGSRSMWKRYIQDSDKKILHGRG